MKQTAPMTMNATILHIICFAQFAGGTGTGTGTGISLTHSSNSVTGNNISGFGHGMQVTLAQPVLRDNVIQNNTNSGLYITGHNSLPALTKTQIAKGALNNSIINNGDTQIRMIYSAGAYMNRGQNNIYSEDTQGEEYPSKPVIRGVMQLQIGDKIPAWVDVQAEGNYWGHSNIHADNLDNFFHMFLQAGSTEPVYSPQYYIDYTPYSMVPYPHQLVQDQELYSSNERESTESRLLTNAMKLEDKGNYRAAIRLYEQIIRRYDETPESYVAASRLPALYEAENEPMEPLIADYEEAIESEKTKSRKFYKEMRITAHLKNKNYDKAIYFAQKMYDATDNEEEQLLALINIAVAEMMRGNDSKSKSGSGLSVSDLLSELERAGVNDKPELELTDIAESLLPERTELFQNYPNPFNPVTQIRFALAKTSDVKLSVYNISGQRVAELASGVKNAGHHAVDFDGSRLNSGIYYYTLEVDGKAITKRMVLTK